MENDKEFFRKYYSEEQMAEFERRAKENPDEISLGTNDWTELIAEVEASLGEDPAGEHAQQLASRWDTLIQRFTLGNTETEESMKALWADQANWPASFKKPYSDEVGEFIRKAREARTKS